MGTFHVDCTIENVAERTRRATVSKLLVDTGSEHTWAPASVLEGIGIKLEKKDVTFAMANGQTVTRSTGFAVIRTGDAFTVDEVVFAEEGDLLLLGARTLEGMNLTVDAAHKKLVAAGPLPAAAQITSAIGWKDAVREALHRYCRRHGSQEIDRQTLIDEELDQIVRDTQSRGKTPDQTLSRVLQELRELRELQFIDDDGHYFSLGRPMD